MENPGSDPPWSDFRSELNSRLLDARTLVVNEALTPTVGARMSEQLTLMDAESEESIHVMMSSVPKGEMEVGLAVHDLLRSLAAPVTVLGAGRIVGAGVIAFVGAAADRRIALPHARFRFEEPKSQLEGGQGRDLETEAEELADRHERVVEVLASATGQPADQIAEDLSERRALDAEEAMEYGLIHRIVEHRREID